MECKAHSFWLTVTSHDGSDLDFSIRLNISMLFLVFFFFSSRELGFRLLREGSETIGGGWGAEPRAVIRRSRGSCSPILLPSVPRPLLRKSDLQKWSRLVLPMALQSVSCSFFCLAFTWLLVKDQWNCFSQRMITYRLFWISFFNNSYFPRSCLVSTVA